MSDVKSKYRVMKFNGDDIYSFAIFHKEAVRGMNSPICWDPKPIVCGMSYNEAWARKKRMDKQDTLAASTEK